MPPWLQVLNPMCPSFVMLIPGRPAVCPHMIVEFAKALVDLVARSWSLGQWPLTPEVGWQACILKTRYFRPASKQYKAESILRYNRSGVDIFWESRLPRSVNLFRVSGLLSPLEPRFLVATLCLLLGQMLHRDMASRKLWRDWKLQSQREQMVKFGP